MTDEPEIVKEMRQAEKLGTLQKKIHSSYKELYLTEEENKDSENKYKLLVEQSIQGIVIVQDFCIKFANNAFAKLSGYNIEELFSLSPEQVKELIHPDDQELVWTRFQERLAGKPVPSRYEYRGIRKDGSIRWFEMSAHCIIFNGKPAIQGVIIDITEHKEFMDALKESEEQFRLAFENAIDAIFWADPETGIIIKCNRAAELLLEKRKEEVVGFHQTLIHPPEKAEYYANKFKRHIEQNGAFEDEAEIITKSQKIVPVGITASITKIGGKPLIQGIFRDITKQKHAEEKLKRSSYHFKQLFNAMADPVVIIDSKGKFLAVSDKAEEVTGYKREELIGKNFLKTTMVTKKSKVFLIKNLIKRMSGVQLKPYEIEVITKDGEVIPSEINATKVDYMGEPADMVVFRDVRERKKSEKLLRESEEKFRNLAEESPNIIFIVKNKNIVYTNNKFKEIIGYDKDELNKSNFDFLKIITSENNKLKDKNLKRNRTSKDISPYEYSFIIKNGKKIDTIITTKSIKYEGEKAILGIVTDITDLKKTEKDLIKSEEKFKNIANRSADVIVVTDEKGNIDYISPSVKKISDFNQEECIGKSFFKFLYKTDIPKIALHFYQNIKNREDIENFPVRIKGKKNKEIFAEISATPIIKNDKVVGTQGIIRDITEKKIADQRLRESEENYRNIVELAPEGIIKVNTKGTITTINSAFSQLTGYSKEEIVGKHISKLPTMRKRDLPKYLKLFGSLLRGNKQPSIEYDWIHKDGTLRLAEARASILKKDNKIIGLQAFLRDITEEKKAERDLHEAHEKLKSMNLELEKKVEERTSEINKILKQKDEFISQLGHDLKNPLNPIVNLLPLILKKEQDENSKELINAVIRNVDFMKNLVIKTIQLARLNVPNVKFSIEKINLLTEINNVLEKNKSILDETRFKIENKLNRDIIVKTDKLRFEELFDNLINNAIKYSPNGGKITIDAIEENNFITISIKDSGIGMTMNQIDHIFDEFYKADKSRHDFDSSGLGLPICKRIVEKQGGKIWVESPGIGKGSTFYFTVYKDYEKISKNIIKEKK